MLRHAVRKFVLAILRQRRYRLLREVDIPFGFDWLADAEWALEGEKPRNAFDVGANDGGTAICLKRRFPDIEIDCFEPVPKTFNVLKDNVKSLTGVHCHQLALSDRSGQFKMITSENSNTNRLAEGNVSETSQFEIVTCSTIDEICRERNVGLIDLLKIDVEGKEIEVLNGAANKLSRGEVRVLLCEFEFLPNSIEPHGNFQEIYEFMTQLDYSIVSVYSEGVDRCGLRWGNVLFSRMRKRTREFYRSPYGTPILGAEW
jgi:FkbM family methyltransferase